MHSRRIKQSRVVCVVDGLVFDIESPVDATVIVVDIVPVGRVGRVRIPFPEPG